MSIISEKPSPPHPQEPLNDVLDLVADTSPTGTSGTFLRSRNMSLFLLIGKAIGVVLHTLFQLKSFVIGKRDAGKRCMGIVCGAASPSARARLGAPPLEELTCRADTDRK